MTQTAAPPEVPPVFKDSAEYTLVMDKVKIRCLHGSSQGAANVCITAKRLDSHGFVTDSVAFLKEFESRDDLDIPDIGPALIKSAERRLGNRLVRVSATIKHGDNVTHYGDEPAEEIPAAAMIGVPAFDFRAALIDKDVCGGYNGHLRSALSLRVSDHASRNVSAEDVRCQVREGFPRDRYFKASCEEVVGSIGNRVHGLLGSDLYSVNTTVFNSTGKVCSFWTPDLDVPEFARPAKRFERLRSITEDQRLMKEKKNGYYILSLGC